MRKLFVFGDSISIKYGPYLKGMVENSFHYDRKRGEEQALADLDNPVGANGGDSNMVLEYLKGERDRGVRYDLLLLNCGLHDIKTQLVTGMKQVPVNQYRDNLEKIVLIARETAQTLIWVRTTDALEEIHNTRATTTFHRFHEDVVAYNAVADEIMNNQGVSMVDLYSFTRIFGASAYCDHVHFKEEIRCLQAAYIAGFLEKYRLKSAEIPAVSSNSEIGISTETNRLF
ncbi:SGNH/GDSL hydrolase family protein [Paenibacillus puerhi]|uniref:SGNH/GDSL hydrolase family protein n=1 Tax=Paenibacillus puerhi TaxID=2692622 RepID=UPI00135995F2|nr:SGNH/GDSL hydrolase family protein [Paenibacillus puerhi]